MPITESERKRRKNFIGSSDAAAILGLNPWRTAFDVWADKTGKIVESVKESTSDAIDVGNWCEEAVLRWFGSTRGLSLVLNDENDRNRREHPRGVLAANIDAFVDGDPSTAVEAKTHGVVSRMIDEGWGEEGTDEVPERIAIQAQHQMAVVPALRVVHVPVLLGGVGLRAYRIDRDDKLIANLEDALRSFWSAHVLTDNPPKEGPSISVAKKLRRVPAKTVPVQEAVLSEWLAAKAAAKVVEDRKKAAEAALLASLGDAEAAECRLGTVTYFMSKPRAAYTVPAGPGYRTLRFNPNKEVP